MPLSKTSKKVLARMKKQYGDKKGEEIFYATAAKKTGKQGEAEKASTWKESHVVTQNAEIMLNGEKYLLEAGDVIQVIEEAEYKGKKVKLRQPFRTPDGPKKFSVYVKNDKGNVVKVNFGDPDMEIKRDDPDRRKAFRSRHGCDKGRHNDPTKPGYWSCRMWEKGTSVSDLTK